MKGLTFYISICILFTCCTKKVEENATISFQNDTLDFGSCYRGEKIRTSLIFYNSGTDSLRLKSISASCGCTTIQISKYVVAPRDSGKIEIQYDSQRDAGIVIKTIITESNTEPILNILYLKGEVRHIEGMPLKKFTN